MPYYPLSQIKPNLYTNGGEYILSTTKLDYIGYYYEVSTGKKYTGKTPQDGSNILLLNATNTTNDFPQASSNPITDPLSVTYYNSALTYPKTLPNGQVEEILYPNDINATLYSTTNPISPRVLPTPNITLPTQKDYNLGVFQRYFCKKNNENFYFEIDQNTYNLLFNKSPQIAYDLYSSQYIMWYIKGNKETVYSANKGLVDVIEKNQKWYGFSQCFKNDFLKYYLEP